MTASKARAAASGDSTILAELATRLLCPDPTNLVERPWGGQSIRSYKRLSEQLPSGDWPWGEAFEISAYDDDAEARQYPSRLRLDDDSVVDLPALLAHEANAEALLGAAFVRRSGARFPLLPKTLCVKELLSVQGHPEGHTEVYIIIDAEPGATLRLGFSRDIDAAAMEQSLTRGIAQQSELLSLFEQHFDALNLQRAAQPFFANRHGSDEDLRQWLAGHLPGAKRDAAAGHLNRLKSLYWEVLDSMNAIEVQAGQVIYNATPQRLVEASGRQPSAEVHALGNPEGKEILALEVRLPGPTFRAWDNVRFPQRRVDVAAAIGALNLQATSAEEFICAETPVAGRDGVSVSVDSEYFSVEHLRPESQLEVQVPAASPHSLHCLEGSVECFNAAGEPVGQLGRGESALVPVGVGAYRVRSNEQAHVVRVTLPGD